MRPPLSAAPSPIPLTSPPSPITDGASSAIFGRRLEVLQTTSSELEKETSGRCLAVQGDVRKIETLEAAVKATLKEFGRIDFVVCGAAGNFLAPLEGMSSNAFKTVLEIDSAFFLHAFPFPRPYSR